MLSYALPTFIFKDLTNYFNNYEIIVFYHLLYHIFISGAIILLIFYKKGAISKFITNTGNLPNKLKLLMTGIIILGLISQFAYFQILEQLMLTLYLLLVRGADTVVVMVVGYFIYREHLTVLKIMGIFLVMAGILMINYF